ncbi:MAG TPA: lipoyl(octanoyl) transferase LipB [Gammaproteobacteria bacterium]|nr:lipoyl(octanoyl) transferase LipB [Gammaproteobacteria bacterium]
MSEPRILAEPSADAVIIRRLGLVPYASTFAAMREFTERRDDTTPDEIWLLQHPPVFTLGLTGKREHLLAPGEIPIIETDRGGQVTYHGPGQLVLYPLLNLRRRDLGVRRLVTILEQSVVGLLADLGIAALARPDAPGVYVDDRKIASLGLRVRRGCSYHGLSLNVAIDLEPFQRINPCGYAGLEVTQLRDLAVEREAEAIEDALLTHLLAQLRAQASPAAATAV